MWPWVAGWKVQVWLQLAAWQQAVAVFCRDRRSTRCNAHSDVRQHLVSQVQPILADVAREAPLLLSLLPQKACTALSVCNKQLRQLVHKHCYANTTSITIRGITNFGAVLSQGWPSLRLIILPNCQLLGSYSAALASHDLELQAVLTVTQNTCTHTVLVVSPRMQLTCSTIQQSQNRLTECLTVVCGELSKPRWEQLSMLSIHTEPTQLRAPDIAALSHFHHTTLKHLLLSANKLDAEIMEELVTAFSVEASNLAVLDLCQTSMCYASMQELVQGSWPKQLWLCSKSNPFVSAAAVRLLSNYERWSELVVLKMSGVSIDVVCMTELRKMGSGSFMVVVMEGCSLDTAAMSAFLRAPWTQLCFLNLRNNNLDTDAIAALVTTFLPNLNELDLGKNKLGESAAELLTTSNWPRLTKLQLNSNCLNNAAITFISSGQWPHLMGLEVSQNTFDSLGVSSLRAGKWPHLRSLVLPKRLFLLSVWRWLNLDLAEYAKLTHHTCVFPLTVTRLLLPAGTEYWPNLRKVRFA